jgi:hypothetical protein
LILTRRGTGMDWYYGGSFIETDAVNTNIDAGTGGIRLGQGDGTNFFDGLMDETFVAIRGLRPEEIKAVYLKGLNGKEVTSTEIKEWNGYAQIIWVD